MAERNTWPAGSDGLQMHELCIPPSITQRRMRAIHSNVVGVARNHRQRHQQPTRRLDTRTGESSTRTPSRSTLWDRDSPSTSRDPDRERHLAHEDVTPYFNIPPSMSSALSRKTPSSGGLRRLVDEQVNDPSGTRRRFWAEKSDNRRRDGHSSASLFSPEATTSFKVSTAATSLPFDVLQRIAGSFSWQDLWSATLTCKTWCKGLEPLREGMLFLQWGKKFKHGHGVAKNLDKALQSFTKGAVRGCAAAMVDAGLLLWEMGRRDEGVKWYQQAAELRHPAGMCNLGLAYLQEFDRPAEKLKWIELEIKTGRTGDAYLKDFSRPVEAVKWLKMAAKAGHARAQHSLASCYQQGRGIEPNLQKSARWYLQSAEGGSSRGMYNIALCLRFGEGVNRNLFEAKRWMRRAAMAGHGKAMFEHGLTLFAEGEGGPALVFLELATRAGETGATHIRDALLVQLSPRLRAHALACADNFQIGYRSQR
ncbi:hypothetical protein M758_5G073000 [Ceratodon purpureus]|nr:hypothetical protein M758_5G073000 [Ceratodon purpureus]